MKFCGYDTQISVKGIESSDIVTMEEFVRTEMESFLTDDADRSDYYGPYHADSKNFKILPGHKKLIFAIKNYVARHPEDFYIPIMNVSSSISEMQTLSGYSKQHTHSISENISKSHPDAKTILSCVKNWIKNQKYSLGLTSTKVSNDLIEKLNSTSLSDIVVNGDKARIKCLICNSDDSFISVANAPLKGGGYRWVISNFVRHIKVHFFPPKSHQRNEHESFGCETSWIPETEVTLKCEPLHSDYAL